MALLPLREWYVCMYKIRRSNLFDSANIEQIIEKASILSQKPDSE
jgi:hypothetical protein